VSGAGATRPRISIITVNYETSDMVARLAASLAEQDIPHEFIIVDNPSAAHDIENIRGIADARIVESPENVGYGMGLNSGARFATGDHIGILNPDAAVPPGQLRAWVEVLERENAAGRRIGVLGPRLVNDNGTPQRSAYQFVNPLNYWAYHSILAGALKTFRKRVAMESGAPEAQLRRVGWVMGAAMLLPRDVWEAAGGFSPSYFMYAEDTDLCWRVSGKGWNVYYAPEVTFIHTQGEPAPEHRDRGMMMLFTSIRVFLRERYPPLKRGAVSTSVIADMLLRIAAFAPLAAIRPGDTLTRSRLRGAVRILRMFAGGQ
jgi:N-acetylglucosaminyl-diphospho-decaprenol L-rhamnosyltransferase